MHLKTIWQANLSEKHKCALQLASASWDSTARLKYGAEQGEGASVWNGSFSMVKAAFHDSIRVLAHKSVGIIGAGTSGTVI